MDRNDRVKIVFFGIEIVILKIIDQDCFVIRIHDPVLLYAGILILVKLEKHILGAGGGREDFQHKIRRALKAFRVEIVRLADHKQIRLYHSLVVHVQSDITGGQIYFAPAFMSIRALAEKNMKFSQNLLMNNGRGRHVVEHTVDQFYPALVGKSIVVIQSIFSVFFGGGSRNIVVCGRFFYQIGSVSFGAVFISKRGTPG